MIVLEKMIQLVQLLFQLHKLNKLDCIKDHFNYNIKENLLDNYMFLLNSDLLDNQINQLCVHQEDSLNKVIHLLVILLNQVIHHKVIHPNNQVILHNKDIHLNMVIHLKDIHHNKECHNIHQCLLVILHKISSSKLNSILIVMSIIDYEI